MRKLFSYLAASRFTEVGRKLGITGMGIGKCADRAQKGLDTQRIIAEYLQ